MGLKTKPAVQLTAHITSSLHSSWQRHCSLRGSPVHSPVQHTSASKFQFTDSLRGSPCPSSSLCCAASSCLCRQFQFTASLRGSPCPSKSIQVDIMLASVGFRLGTAVVKASLARLNLLAYLPSTANESNAWSALPHAMST